jgi:hypothetical protein
MGGSELLRSLQNLNPRRSLVSDDLHRNHPPMEGDATGAQDTASLGGYSVECGSEHGIRERAGGHRDDSRDTRPDRAPRFVETTLGRFELGKLVLPPLRYSSRSDDQPQRQAMRIEDVKPNLAAFARRHPAIHST